MASGCGAYLQDMCFVFGYLDIVYIWNALIWSASQTFLKYIQSENLKMLIEDDDELMLNVLRCHLTY